MKSLYFVDDEFRCPCCSSLPVDGMSQRLIDVLDCIREDLGVPVYVNSGYRCYSHNVSVGGVSNSQHLLGTAADITYDGVDVDYLASLAESYGADGIGLYPSQGFVHVDVRGTFACWSE